MKKRIPKINRPSSTSLLSALALCLFLFSVIQCGRYTGQINTLREENARLSAALTDEKQRISDVSKHAQDLQDQLTEANNIEEKETENGFIKKGNVYLIDRKEQLWTLQKLLAKKAEIEPGIPAATASYRLRRDIDFDQSGSIPLFYLGTEETPFYGSFDGDGHKIRGYFPLRKSAYPTALFHTDRITRIENLNITNYYSDEYLLARRISTSLSEQWECTELEQHLPNTFRSDSLNGSIAVEISAWDLDVQKISENLRKYWEKIIAQADGNDYSISMTFFPQDKEGQDTEPPEEGDAYIQKIQTALLTLAGPEYSEIIKECLTQEEGYLWFLRIERVGDLICCTFEIGEPDFSPDTRRGSTACYHLITEGTNGNKCPRQCFYIPYTDSEMYSIGTEGYYRIESVDLDFDGKEDLLIHEGISGGSGGSWSNYRALVRKEETGGYAYFSYFPSFPSQITSLELGQQRIVTHSSAGTAYEHVIVYEIVNGEYAPTRELIAEAELTGPDGEVTVSLSYYEMGELVKVHILSDWDEIVGLYPDMDYWITG